MELLYISWRTPYSSVSHAGGKTFNYYIKGMAKQTNNNIVLLTLGNEKDRERCDCSEFGIKTIFINDYIDAHGWKNKILKKWIFGRSCGLYNQNIIGAIKNALVDLQKSEYTPDVVIMEWTQMVLLIDIIKRFFPKAKYIASEHDVSFLGLERKYRAEKNIICRPYRYMKYKVVYIRECKALKRCNLVLCHNRKDVKLLENNNVYGARSIVPYYDRYYLRKDDASKSNYITFFGAMAREENYKSVIWFIENVMPLISDLEFTFCVLGANPPEELKKYASKKILVTGFVEDITEYLNKTKAAVLPLVLGAGIKVKVLEFAAAGIPIVTNEIGIEGIPLERNSEYLHCETAEEYANTIRKILLNEIDLASISKNEVISIKEYFGLDESLKNYISWLED